MSFQKRPGAADREMDLNKIFMVCLFVLGNLYFTHLLLQGSSSGYTAYRLQTGGRVVIGTVVGQKTVKDIKPHLVNYYPIIEYQVNGKTHTRIGSLGSGHPEYETGERVELLYDPSNPDVARINTWDGLWFHSGFILLFVPIASVTGNLMLLQAWMRHAEMRRRFRERHQIV